jgi:N-methylhydantoinase A/oxoprolinase/acetone carboxylase beta subunit
VLGRRQPFALEPPGGDGAEAPRRGRRRIYLRSTRSLEEVEVLDGDLIAPRQSAAGPVVIDTRTTTIVVPESFDVAFDPSGSFVLTRR